MNGSDGREHFIERDDGLLESINPGVFFGTTSDWWAIEAAVSERSGSRVLDIGAGAGRHAIPLQEAGRSVVALDVSSGAIDVCRRRGVLNTSTGTVFEYEETGPEPFDTFLLCGNNYGLLESPEHASKFLGVCSWNGPGWLRRMQACTIALPSSIRVRFHMVRSWSRRSTRAPSTARAGTRDSLSSIRASRPAASGSSGANPAVLLGAMDPLRGYTEVAGLERLHGSDVDIHPNLVACMTIDVATMFKTHVSHCQLVKVGLMGYRGGLPDSRRCRPRAPRINSCTRSVRPLVGPDR